MKFSTFAMLAVTLSAATQEARAELPNPYGTKPYEIDEIKAAVSPDECDYLQKVTVTKTNAKGALLKETTEYHCLRALDEPKDKNYKKAIKDAAKAIRKGKMEELDNIVNAWPNAKREDLRRKAFAKADPTAQLKFEKSYQTPTDGSFEPAELRYYSRPYFMNKLTVQSPKKSADSKVERKRNFGRRHKSEL